MKGDGGRGADGPHVRAGSRGVAQQGSVGSSGEEWGVASREARGERRRRSLHVRAVGAGVVVQQARVFGRASPSGHPGTSTFH